MVVRHLLDTLLERMFRIHVPNAGITRIRIDGQGQQAMASLMFHAGSL
jgi:alpha-ribazole phosphatase/probable phosphoglycerate mutase